MRHIMFHYILLATLFSATSVLLHGFSTASKEGESCSKNSDCEWGMECGLCFPSGVLQGRCIRVIPVHPYLQVKQLPYNKYSWLTTRSSYASLAESFSLLALSTQDDTITDQLKSGVRGLMLDMHDYEDDIWLCFTQCSNPTAYQLAKNVLNEVRVFLELNPLEVVTIFIEDHVESPNGLTKLFDGADLRKFLFPLSRMPRNGGNWPIIDYMIKRNKRLVIFTSRPDKEVSEGLAYKWNYMVENQYNNDLIPDIQCLNRSESAPMNDKSKTLVLMNYFRVDPDISNACKYNAEFLGYNMIGCSIVASNRFPNFIVLDFYKRSVNGEVARVIDMANGRSICGCDTVAFCKANKRYGDCNPS